MCVRLEYIHYLFSHSIIPFWLCCWDIVLTVCNGNCTGHLHVAPEAISITGDELEKALPFSSTLPAASSPSSPAAAAAAASSSSSAQTASISAPNPMEQYAHSLTPLMVAFDSLCTILRSLPDVPLVIRSIVPTHPGMCLPICLLCLQSVCVALCVVPLSSFCFPFRFDDICFCFGLLLHMSPTFGFFAFFFVALTESYVVSDIFDSFACVVVCWNIAVFRGTAMYPPSPIDLHTFFQKEKELVESQEGGEVIGDAALLKNSKTKSQCVDVMPGVCVLASSFIVLLFSLECACGRIAADSTLSSWIALFSYHLSSSLAPVF